MASYLTLGTAGCALGPGVFTIGTVYVEALATTPAESVPLDAVVQIVPIALNPNTGVFGFGVTIPGSVTSATSIPGTSLAGELRAAFDFTLSGSTSSLLAATLDDGHAELAATGDWAAMHYVEFLSMTRSQSVSENAPYNFTVCTGGAFGPPPFVPCPSATTITTGLGGVTGVAGYASVITSVYRTTDSSAGFGSATPATQNFLFRIESASTTVVPEPSTEALIILGLVSLGIMPKIRSLRRTMRQQ